MHLGLCAAETRYWTIERKLPKPRKINKNADALPRMKINHFKQCSDFNSKSKIYTSNEDKTEHLD